MRDALIDLGEVPSGGPGETETALPRAPLPYRWILGLLTALLVVLLGGGGPPPQPPPGPVVLPITLGDGIRTGDGRLYVIGQAEPIGTVIRTYAIQAYDLPAVTPAGVYRVTVSGDVFSVVDAGDGLLLVSYNDNESATLGLMAVRPGGGAPVWRRAANLFGISADHAMALVQEESLPGRPENHNVWRALDPRTGQVRWSVEQPVDGQLTMAPGFYSAGFPPRFYVVHGDGRVVTHDALTGAPVGGVRLPRPLAEDSVIWVAGGLLLAGYGDDETIAYDALTLTERWRADGGILPEEGYAQSCEPMVCVAAIVQGLTGFDPATGRRLWRSAGYDSSEVIDGHVLIARASQSEPALAVLDPSTGRTTEVPGFWTSGGPGPSPGTAWVYRLQAVGYELRYGVLDLATGRVRLLGHAEWITGDCRFTTGVLICRRADSTVAVWRL
ncbi:PQQ-binding-like beta-propeller repeat protein [Actinoplanes philippinensis]|uniref:outer membrane protein assembly factor BamB family protein n=1 Tax=Actinoplanes philippinensis TaxID=35752 RepID=UPI0033F63879